MKCFHVRIVVDLIQSCLVEVFVASGDHGYEYHFIEMSSFFVIVSYIPYTCLTNYESVAVAYIFLSDLTMKCGSCIYYSCPV